MDDIDKLIVGLIQKDPGLTHTQIASRVNRSQPTVGMRIKKLEDSGILKFQAGINLKATDLSFANVEIQTNNPTEILKVVNNCPFMLNAFRLSGTSNIYIFMASFSLQNLDKIVNYHFRSSPDVMNVKIKIVTEVLKDYVLPLELNFNNCSCDINDHCLEEI